MLQRFFYFARETWQSLIRNWSMTVAGVLTIAVSLVFLGGTILNNRRVGHGTAQWKGNTGAEIFMRVDATELQKNDVQRALKQDSAPDGTVKSWRFIDHEDALAEFKRLFRDDPDIANSVTDAKTLPESYKVRLRDASDVSAVIDEYRIKAGVEDIVTPRAEIKRRLDLLEKQRVLMLSIAGVLAVCAGVLIVNTIRLAIYARRREIEVMKLVGASNWFVRVPFMAEGLVQGVLGGLLAAGGVYFAKFAYEEWFYQDGSTDYLTNADAFFAGLVVLLMGAVLGVISSLFGLWRRLDV